MPINSMKMRSALSNMIRVVNMTMISMRPASCRGGGRLKGCVNNHMYDEACQHTHNPTKEKTMTKNR